jgi:hypothetical protein
VRLSSTLNPKPLNPKPEEDGGGGSSWRTAVVRVKIIKLARRWSSNPSGKCSCERTTRGTVCGTIRSMCGADSACLAINYQSLKLAVPAGLSYTGLEDAESPSSLR